jgi:hypothetical protein
MKKKQLKLLTSFVTKLKEDGELQSPVPLFINATKKHWKKLSPDQRRELRIEMEAYVNHT